MDGSTYNKAIGRNCAHFGSFRMHRDVLNRKSRTTGKGRKGRGGNLLKLESVTPTESQLWLSWV